MAGECLAWAQREAGLSQRELARRDGTSHATLRAYERGTESSILLTFLRIIEARGFTVNTNFQPRFCLSGGVARGRELVEVLRLAAQFPGRPSRTLDAPDVARLVQDARDRSGQ